MSDNKTEPVKKPRTPRTSRAKSPKPEINEEQKADWAGLTPEQIVIMYQCFNKVTADMQSLLRDGRMRERTFNTYGIEVIVHTVLPKEVLEALKNDRFVTECQNILTKLGPVAELIEAAMPEFKAYDFSLSDHPAVAPVDSYGR